MSKIKAVKRDYGTSLEQDFNSLIEEWGQKNGRNEDEILYELLFILKTHFEDMKEQNRKAQFFDLDPIIKRISQRTKYQTNKKQYLLGCLVFGLNLFGSSWEQAYEALSKYLGSGPDLYKKARYVFEKKMYNNEMGKDEFVSLYGYSLRNLISKNKDEDGNPKQFPSGQKIKKARKAYEQLIKEIDAYIDSVD